MVYFDQRCAELRLRKCPRIRVGAQLFDEQADKELPAVRLQHPRLRGGCRGPAGRAETDCFGFDRAPEQLQLPRVTPHRAFLGSGQQQGIELTRPLPDRAST